MTVQEQLACWRAEITLEIGQLEGDLAPLRAELAAAEREIGRLSAAHAKLEEAIARGPAPFAQGVAAPLFGRLLDARQNVKREITRLRGSLPSRIAALEERIADRRLAVTQIDRALTEGDEPIALKVIRRPRSHPEVSPFLLEAAS